MGFGHIFVKAEQQAVADAITQSLAPKGFRRIEMTPDRHPRQMKSIHEARLRLFWISPRLGSYTGIFEFRYYANENRERWGYTDEHLGQDLSKTCGDVWRLEVLDGSGFWMYVRYEAGEEKEGKAYQDTVADRTTDRTHPRYELNHIIEREGLKNIGLGYEHLPGPQVAPIENVPQDPSDVEGLEGFLHLAFESAGPSETEAQ